MTIAEAPPAVEGTQPSGVVAVGASGTSASERVQAQPFVPVVQVSEQIFDGATGTFRAVGEGATPPIATTGVVTESAAQSTVAPSPPPTLTRTEHESEVERRVQEARRVIEHRLERQLEQRQQQWQQDYERRRQEEMQQEQARIRQETEAHERARVEAEERDLYTRWKAGDAQAEAVLTERYSEMLAQKYDEKAQEAQQLLAQREQEWDQRQKQQFRQFIADRWAAHAGAFGIAPDDETVISAPEAVQNDFKALNLLLLKKMADPAAIDAVKENATIQTWVAQLQQTHQQEVERLQKEKDEAVEKARLAAALDAQARLIGTGQVPSSDLTESTGGSPTTINERLRAFIENSSDPDLANWYRRYRAAPPPSS